MNEEADAYLADSRVDFDGAHQAGIATPEQAFNKLIAFNLRDGRETVEDARRLLRLWTDDARRMCSGLAGLADPEPENMVATANLTITVGFGRSFRINSASRRRTGWRTSPSIPSMSSATNGLAATSACKYAPTIGSRSLTHPAS